MKDVKLYRSVMDLMFKLASNVVSTKVWIAFIATVALFEGLVNQYVWVAVVGGLFGIRELIKPLLVRAQTEVEPTDALAGEDEVTPD